MILNNVESERLRLIPVTAAKIRDMFRTMPPQEIRAFFGCGDEQFQRLTDMNEKGMETNRLSLFHFVLRTKADNRPIGECGFHTWNSSHKRAELYYFLHHEQDRRKGYLSEAMPLVLEHGFDQMGLHRIEALVGNENIPSVRLLQKNGFSFEGIMREDYCIDGKNYDSHCYSLLKHEWQRSKT